jgi:hypothetical protein
MIGLVITNYGPVQMWQCCLHRTTARCLHIACRFRTPSAYLLVLGRLNGGRVAALVVPTVLSRVRSGWLEGTNVVGLGKGVLNPVPPKHEADHHPQDSHVHSNRSCFVLEMKIVNINYITCP